jgi:glycosyltransferase involved in cell wall biosynthesis
VLARADLAVFPSHMESQGLVIVEAMACGKAVVTSRTGPGPEIIEDGVSGLLCDPHDPTSIAAKSIALLKDSSRRAEMGSAARARAVDVFSEQALAKRTATFYQHCVGAAHA